MIKKNFKYIDLFSGIGGFHQAMGRLGGKCVYACDIDEKCREVYKKNFCCNSEFIVASDINDIAKNPETIPQFDVLCAGFPCQTFSKAGHRNGFNEVTKENGKVDNRGQLFFRIIDVLKAHPEAKFVILENVRNLADDENNWNIVKEELMQIGFVITEKAIILSPHQFGIPQVRERVYILGVRKEFKNSNVLTNGYIHLDDLNIESEMRDCPTNCIESIINPTVEHKYFLDSEQNEMLKAWAEFKRKTKIKTIGKPIWIVSFGVGFESTDAFYNDIGYYDQKRDRQGNLVFDENNNPVPLFPKWKKDYVDWNRKFYLMNKYFIDDWIVRYKMDEKHKLFRKFEWNCGEDCKNINEGITQIRQSGIRVKRPNCFPSLVAMNNTPIIFDKHKNKYRFITPKEAAKLQSFDENFIFDENDKISYKQLGNSVNVKIIEIIATKLFNLGTWRKPYGKKD